jgi:hypothetical protein
MNRHRLEIVVLLILFAVILVQVALAGGPGLRILHPFGAFECILQAGSVCSRSKADWISAPPSAIDRSTAIHCCASASRSTARGDPDGGRSRNKSDARPHDAICRIVNVLAVDDSVRRVCDRRADPEC